MLLTKTEMSDRILKRSRQCYRNSIKENVFMLPWLSW